MKPAKSITSDFFDFFTSIQITEKVDPAFARYLDIISSITVESLYVLNVQQGQISYVSPHADSFLCGYPVEEALCLGYDFYKEIIYPADLTGWKNAHKAILQYIKDYKDIRHEIDYFSCTFRLQRKYSFHSKSLPQMIFQRMKPVWEDDKLRYLICSVGSSTAKEAGNLRMYNKDGLTYKEYSFVSRRWKQIELAPLTEQERAILMLAQQGKNTIAIADDLIKAISTVGNQIKPLFSKLNVHSIIEAIDNASIHRMMYKNGIIRNCLIITPPPPLEEKKTSRFVNGRHVPSYTTAVRRW